MDNLDLLIEYTRINPWVYEHKYESTTYKHYNYTLGHWIGQNADQVKIQFNYQPVRGLRFELYFEGLRKGGLDDIYYAYGGTDEFNKSFLYAPLRSDKYLGISCIYEYIHDLLLVAKYRYSDISDEDPNRTPVNILGKKNTFSFSLSYGM